MFMRNNVRRSVCAAMLLAGGAVGPLAIAADSISAILSAPLVMYDAPDTNAPRRNLEVAKGPAPAGWKILETKTPFYHIDAGAYGSGWVSRSAIAKGAHVPDTSCGNTYAGQQAQVTGGASGMGNCKLK